jgi:fibronectin type 3 domain-containing protein
MKKVRFISYLLVLILLISVIFIPSISLAAASQISAGGKTYDTFNFDSSQQIGKPQFNAKVFLPKGWQPHVPDQFMPRTPGFEETKNLTGAAKPAVPTGLIVTKTTNNSITIKWNKVSGAKKYTVFISTSKSSGYKSKGSTKSTTYTVKGLKKNKTYYIKVRSENAKGKSAQSAYVTGKATTKPGVTTGLTAKPIDAHTIQLMWKKAVNATYYEVYGSKDGGNFSYIGKTTKLGVTINGLNYNADYCFGIVAYNKSGYTVGGIVYCNTLRYPAPTGLTAKVVDGNKAQLTWKGVSGGKKYDIYYAYDGDTYYRYCDSTALTSYTTAELKENCNCHFSVCSNFDGDQSDLSKEAMIITGYGKPETPYMCSANTFGIEHIYLNWSNISNATDYRIYVSAAADGPYALIGRPVSSLNSYAFYGIAPSTDYYFKVSAVNHDVEGEQSAYEPVHVGGVPNLYYPTEYSNYISLTWSSITGATSYNIYKSNTMYGTYTYVGSTNLASYSVTSYTPNTVYYFCVTSKNDYGESSLCYPEYIHTKKP